MSVQKELSDLMKLAKGRKKEVIKAIMNDDQLADEFIKRIQERQAEKQLQENIGVVVLTREFFGIRLFRCNLP